MEVVPFFVILAAGGALCFWAALTGRAKLGWWLLPGVAVALCLYDLASFGGFNLDGVTSFPIFLGIVGSVVWIPLWAITGGLSLWMKRRKARLSHH